AIRYQPRRRREGGSGDQPAVPELRGAPPRARLLVEPSDARVLRPLAAAHGLNLTGEFREGKHPADADSRGRLVAAHEERDEAVRAVAHSSTPARGRAWHQAGRLVAASAAASVSLRRLWQLHLHGVASHAAEA